MRARTYILMCAMALAGAARAEAWAWSVHRLVAFRAMQAMGAELPLPAERAWPVLWRAAVAPDAAGPGQLPPIDHVFHVTRDRRARPMGNAPRRIQELTWRLMSEELPDDQVVFELGRICHLVADLSQPLHADGKARNPDCGRVHPLFEKDADADRELASVAAVAPTTGTTATGWESRMEALAGESSRDFDAVCAAYAPGHPGYAAVRDVTRRRVACAQGQTLAIWRAILAQRGAAARRRREAASWAYVSVPLVLLWFLIRGRVKREEGRWPGQGTVRRDGRDASERAFRKLEERLGLGRDTVRGGRG